MLIVAVATPPLVATDIFFPDFLVYRAGGEALLRHIPLYGPEFPVAVKAPWGLAFTYPPVAAVGFILLAVLPVSVGQVVAFGVSLLAAAGAMWIFQRHAVRGPAPLLAFPVVLAAGLLLEPFRTNFEMGQINTVLMLLVVADCLLPFKRWPRGILVGLAGALKLTPLAFILYFAIRRDWRAMFISLASFAGITLIGFVLSPGNSMQYWFHTLRDTNRIGALADPWNQSLNGALFRLPLDGAEKALWLLSVAVVAAVGMLALRRCVRADDKGLALLVTAAIDVLISPVSWSHHWVWVGLFVVWCVNRSLRSRRVLEDLVFAAVIVVFWRGPHWLMPQPDELHPWTWSQHLIGDTYILAALVFLAAVACGWGVTRPDPAPAPVSDPAERDALVDAPVARP